MTATAPWTIVGQGLAGTCLAWQLWQRGAPFRIVDREAGGASRVAAGLVNPVTGRNFEPSKRIDEFLPESLEFHEQVGRRLGLRLWHPLPVLRLAASAEEWGKMRKKAERPEIARWLTPAGDWPVPPGWHGVWRLTGGGRLDLPAFLDGSRGFFAARGLCQHGEIDDAPVAGRLIRCEGAAGLIAGRMGAHRCAKGEILTIHAPAWDDSAIRIGAGGWLVPLGGGRFKAGATYEWADLTERPTEEGCRRIVEIATGLGGTDFGILAHEAGVRPILRRSEPLIGPLADGSWFFNGLGSKGTLYAPGCARRLADWLLDGIEPDEWLDVRKFVAG